MITDVEEDKLFTLFRHRARSAGVRAVLDEATGKPVRMLGNHVDITERKQAELALAERNAQLVLASKTARVGWYSNDLERDVITVSDGYVAIHGLPEETTETTLSQWRTRVHPDHLAKFEEVKTRTFDINIDITEREDLEDHKNKLIAELDHRVKNVLAIVSTVASRTQETSGSTADFIAALDGRIKSMANRRHDHKFDYQIVRPNGEVRWVESRGFVSYRKDGQPLRVIGRHRPDRVSAPASCAS